MREKHSACAEYLHRLWLASVYLTGYERKVDTVVLAGARLFYQVFNPSPVYTAWVKKQLPVNTVKNELKTKNPPRGGNYCFPGVMEKY